MIRALPLLLLCSAVLLPCTVMADKPAPEPVAWVQLGPINVEHGLSLLNGGDGQNEAVVFGNAKCRRNILESDPPSRCLYFNYDPRASRLQRPVYVAIEYFDDGFGTMRIEYDSADLGAPARGVYKEGATELLLDSRKWRKVIFEIPDARFEGRQNLGADFRLVCSGQVAVRRAYVEMGKSADFERQFKAQRERVAACAGKLSPPRGMQVVFNGPEIHSVREAPQVFADMLVLAPMLKALGATSVESRVRWDLVEQAQGGWDWSLYDGIVAILRENGLKWNPLIVVGPTFGVPDWFMESRESVLGKCLEHGAESKGQSIWNPYLQGWIDRFISEFAARYGSGNIVESILIGMSEKPDGEHSHTGYWCGDDYARADLGKYFQEQYGTVDALNSAWGAKFTSFGEIVPFQPESSVSTRARLDFIKWYRDRMTRWSGQWLAAIRNYLPRTDLYLCTGADGRPVTGLDLAALCKLAARYDAGVCVAGEGSEYALDFTSTRLVAAAARHYGAYCAFEPEEQVTTDGMLDRAFNAAASKVRGIHTSYPTVLTQPGGIAAWSAAYRWLGSGPARRPQVAVLFPKTAMALGMEGFTEKAALLRDALDFDLVDESMIRDNALRRYKALVVLDGKILEREDIGRIFAWVESGGVIVSCNFGGVSTVEGDASLFSHIFDTGAAQSPTVKPCGGGLSIYVTDGWNGEKNPVAAIAHVLDSLSIRVQSNLIPDGVIDGVYVSDLAGRLLVLNTTNHEVERELRVGIGRKRTVKLPARAVVEIR